MRLGVDVAAAREGGSAFAKIEASAVPASRIAHDRLPQRRPATRELYKQMRSKVH